MRLRQALSLLYSERHVEWLVGAGHIRDVSAHVFCSSPRKHTHVEIHGVQIWGGAHQGATHNVRRVPGVVVQRGVGALWQCHGVYWALRLAVCMTAP